MISKLSEDRLKASLRHWMVDWEYAQPMINYLVHGFNPGSFFTAVLANDFTRAMSHSHPSNTISALKNLGLWITNCMPPEAWGDYDRIDRWTNGWSPELRRRALEDSQLIYTAEEETWKVLSE